MTTETEPTADQSQTETDSQQQNLLDDASAKDEFGKDHVFHLLQNQRRRHVLRCLRDVDGTVEMGDVAEQVAAWEHDTTVQALTSDQRQRVYIALYQAHLPKLDEAGVIEYNQSRGYVTPTERADRLAGYLDLPHDEDDESSDDGLSLDTESRWANYYMGATGVSATLFTLTAFDIGIFGSLSTLGVGLAMVVMFGILSLGLAVQRRQAEQDDE